MIVSRILVTAIILSISSIVSADLYGQSVDTIRENTLSEAEFLLIVRNFHPYLQQAGLSNDIANARVLESRGSFDPVLQTSFDKKTFDEKLYYNYFNPEVVLPTWYGVELYAGLENVLGDRTDTERTFGKTSYLGISVPLARDLVIDKRRAILQQAKVIQQQTRAEQILTINDLLNDALNAYWNWVKEYQVYQVVRNAVQLNKERKRLIVIESQQGSRPAIDTTEALAQLQQFEFMESEALLRFRNSGLALSDFLWLKEKERFPWNYRIIPDTNWLSRKDWEKQIPALEEMITRATIEHPKLKTIGFKNDWLLIERKLKFQSYLPKADLKYNILNSGYSVFNKLNTAFLENNYKVGFNFQMPLLLRQGRGAFQQTVIKIRQNSLQLDQARLEIENKLVAYYNEVTALANQIGIYEEALANYQKLFAGEYLRFRMGEGTLFLLNSRETKALEAAQKLYELKTKWYKSYAGLTWSEGRLGVSN